MIRIRHLRIGRLGVLALAALVLLSPPGPVAAVPDPVTAAPVERAVADESHCGRMAMAEDAPAPCCDEDCAGARIPCGDSGRCDGDCLLRPAVAMPALSPLALAMVGHEPMPISTGIGIRARASAPPLRPPISA